MPHAPDRATVILHVGMPKTGTSALQVAFVRNRALLAEHGINYPSDPGHVSMDEKASKGLVVTGNCSILRSYLVLRKAPPDIPPNEVLDRALAPLRTGKGHSSLLFSSEFLHEADPERLASFAEACHALGYDVAAVGHVRNIVGHSLSAYSQLVKRRAFVTTFSEYIEPGDSIFYDPQIRAWVERFQNILGTSATTCLHYDSVRTDLVRHFFEQFLGVPADRLAPPLPHTVNRSLTPHELSLMREVNRQLRLTSGSRVVSDLLIAQPPIAPEQTYITHRDRARLAERFSDEVAWLNAHALAGGGLSVDSEDIDLHEEPPELRAVSPGEQTLARIVASLADDAALLERKKSRRAARRATAAATAAAAAAKAARLAPAPRRGLFRRG